MTSENEQEQEVVIEAERKRKIMISKERLENLKAAVEYMEEMMDEFSPLTTMAGRDAWINKFKKMFPEHYEAFKKADSGTVITTFKVSDDDGVSKRTFTVAEDGKVNLSEHFSIRTEVGEKLNVEKDVYKGKETSLTTQRNTLNKEIRRIEADINGGGPIRVKDPIV